MTARTRARIAILDHTAQMGGGEIALLNLVREIDPRRYEAVVILSADGPLRAALERAGVSVRLFPLESRIAQARKDALSARNLLKLWDVVTFAGFVWRLSRLFARLQVRLVHCNSLKSDVLGGAAARLAGVPSIWHVRDRIESDYLPRAVVQVFRLLARFLPTAIVANSHATLKTLGLPEGRGHVVHDGTIIPSPAPRGHRNGSPIIGLIGRITPWKGQHVFIEAARRVHALFPEARFWIIGAALFDETAYDQQIRKLVRDMGMESVISFLGFRTDVKELIGQMDVLVHASTTGEPFGQVIIEAMAQARPVVATRGGGVPEIVIDGVTGILVPMGKVVEMAEAICRLLADPPLRQRMGEVGLKRAQSQFTIAQTAERVQAVYDSMLDAGAW